MMESCVSTIPVVLFQSLIYSYCLCVLYNQIGDCYVAVTGVPQAQKDHAPRMVKFAASCQIKMQQLLVNKLVDRLGADTAELSLRVGIDSGPITGGILRGDRGRFQLFGDVSSGVICIKLYRGIDSTRNLT